MLNKTSIIILSYNTLELTKLCLESIKKYTPPDLYELIVVDNGSTDGSAEYLAGEEGILLLMNSENRGFPAGCNEGARVASGDSILLLNSDTIVTPNYLNNMRAALFSRENIGAVGVVTNNASNGQKIAANYNSLEELESFAKEFNISDESKWHPYQTLVGFCLLIKRTAYADVGELDENLSPGNFEDDDICLRLRQAGYETLLLDDTFIHHFGNASFKKLSGDEQILAKKNFEKILAKNFGYMQQKWGFSEEHKLVHSFFTNKISDKLKRGTKIAIVGIDFRPEPFIMARKYSGLEIFGVAFSETGAKVAAATYEVEKVDNIAAAAEKIPEGQDIIIIFGKYLPQDNNEYVERIVAGIMTRLKDSGIVYFELGDRVYARTPSNKG